MAMDLPQPGGPSLESFRGLVSAFKHEPTPHKVFGTVLDPGAVPPLLVAVAPQCPTPNSSPPQKPQTPQKRSLSPGPSTPTTSAKRRKVTQDNSNSKDPLLFAHLKPLQHRLKPGLDVLFCGINPGVKSSELGLHFGHPSNMFWRCLHESGLTPKLLRPQDGISMPATYNYGLTDLVQRPTSGEANLTMQEKLEGVQSLLERVASHHPRILALVSFGIWDCVLRRLDDTVDGRGKALHGIRLLPAPTDWTEEVRIEDKTSGRSRRGRGFARWKIVYPDTTDGITETLIIALPSPSGRNGLSLVEKVAHFKLIADALASIKARTYDSSRIRGFIVDVP